MWLEITFNFGVKHSGQSLWWWHFHRHYLPDCHLSWHFGCSLGPLSIALFPD